MKKKYYKAAVEVNIVWKKCGVFLLVESLSKDNDQWQCLCQLENITWDYFNHFATKSFSIT